MFDCWPFQKLVYRVGRGELEFEVKNDQSLRLNLVCKKKHKKIPLKGPINHYLELLLIPPLINVPDSVLKIPLVCPI